MKKRYIVLSFYDKYHRPMYYQSKDKMGTTYISDITYAFRFRTRFMANRVAKQTRFGKVLAF